MSSVTPPVLLRRTNVRHSESRPGSQHFEQVSFDSRANEASDEPKGRQELGQYLVWIDHLVRRITTTNIAINGCWIDTEFDGNCRYRVTLP
jgi:hypothetical protein